MPVVDLHGRFLRIVQNDFWPAPREERSAAALCMWTSFAALFAIRPSAIAAFARCVVTPCCRDFELIA